MNKINKDLKNITCAQNNEISTIKKICLIKKQNRSLVKNIHIINFLHITVAILFSFPIQFRIMEMISEISNVSYNIAILSICMTSYYMFSAVIYYLTTYSLIISIKHTINHNKKIINVLKRNDKEKMNKLIESVKNKDLFDMIKNI